MSSPIFERVCETLEERTDMNRLEARGTVRIALKEAGLDPRHVTSHQMSVVLAQVLPPELLSRGIDDAHAVCQALETVVKSQGDDVTADAGDRIDGLFRRTL
jgi:hypothetical protein